jgi:ribosomal protein L37AE/L43A
MAWQQTTATCPKCGNWLYEDTSTGKWECLECDYESGVVIVHEPDVPSKN